MTDHQLEFHLPAPPVSGDAPLIPARMVNEFVYCPRLAYLMWTQGEWAETGDTVEGHRVHARVDKPNRPLPAPQAQETGETPASDKVVSRSLTLSSTALGVIAKLDIAEAEDGVVTPIDYKRGKCPHVAGGVYEPERIQIASRRCCSRSMATGSRKAPSVTQKAGSACASRSMIRCGWRRARPSANCA